MPDDHRTSDGYVRAEHLRRGAIDQRGWPVGNEWHILRLKLRRRKPELWEVEHRIVRPKGGAPSYNVELFNTLTEARRHFRLMQRNPPTSYPSPEAA
jgi:hypothetical protein